MMTMHKKRFSNFDIFTIHYPFTSIISFLHRVSGIFVFLLIPFLLWLLDSALASQQSFLSMQSTFTNCFVLFVLWLILAALGYHLFAGLRHMIMDIGLGEDLYAARWSGSFVLIISIL